MNSQQGQLVTHVTAISVVTHLFVFHLTQSPPLRSGCRVTFHFHLVSIFEAVSYISSGPVSSVDRVSTQGLRDRDRDSLWGGGCVEKETSSEQVKPRRVAILKLPYECDGAKAQISGFESSHTETSCQNQKERHTARTHTHTHTDTYTLVSLWHLTGGLGEKG